MKTKTFHSFHPLVLLLLSVGSVWAQRGPQDSWYLDREIDLPQMPGMNSPRGIHISANGDIYVCDVGDNDDRISVWRADGSFKTAFSSYGGKDENIRDPHGNNPGMFSLTQMVLLVRNFMFVIRKIIAYRFSI